MRLVLTLVMFLLPWAAHAQVIELMGGASNSFGGGGGLVLYSPNSESRFSAGLLNGRFIYSTSESFEYKHWITTVGDRQYFLTTGQMGLTIPIRGLSASREFKKSAVSIFTGAVGDTFSSPYFFGIHHAKLGAGISYHRELLGGFTVGTIQAVTVQRKTSLGDLGWKPNCNFGGPVPPLAGAGAFRRCWLEHLKLRVQGGLFENNPQVLGNAEFSSRHLGLSANRSMFIFNTVCLTCQMLAHQVTANSFSAFTGLGPFNVSASYFDSKLNRGEALNVGAHFGWFQISASDYKSGRISSEFVSITQHALHWSLTEYITKSNGTWSGNLGVGYTSNRFNFQIGYNELYFPALSRPFQKVLSISVGLRIKSASINGGTIVQPTGRNQFSVGGDDYQSTGLHVPAIGDGEANIRSLPSSSHGGKYVIRGQVVDQDGHGVEGASVFIGKDQVFTDSTGCFSSRQKRKNMPIKVDVNEFLSGSWEVSDVPAQAEPGRLIRIVVKRKN